VVTHSDAKQGQTSQVMSEGSRKRAATSPLNSEFDKKSRLGLTDEQLDDLNETLRYWVLDHSALPNSQDVSARVLAQTFQQIIWNLLAKNRVLTIGTSWTNVKHGEEHINLLSREEQLKLASIWLEAREKGD
jgi:hypothetical protein